MLVNIPAGGWLAIHFLRLVGLAAKASENGPVAEDHSSLHALCSITSHPKRSSENLA